MDLKETNTGGNRICKYMLKTITVAPATDCHTQTKLHVTIYQNYSQPTL